ncbi:hypothetical protein FHS55_001758 [Angulomicrobium tetraedrale]|uniref:Uncharacterized protein n=1 Tax=Ancylobacter tetraedralis TaxID=217068 RepID=A0A839Z643_9HYPH|nr:hypothetical protein [Ancylobacter tetraedralis]MBB3771159.1 hypothetical protein [Ancylobacter tetraedralis]
MTLSDVVTVRPVRAMRWFAGALLLTATALSFADTPAEAAVIYCTRPGYPAGCVAVATRAPAARAVVYCTRPGFPVGCVAGAGAPAARAAVACTRPGFPAGCVAGPAGVNANARAVARPGPGVNGGGPVNGPGLR